MIGNVADIAPKIGGERFAQKYQINKESNEYHNRSHELEHFHFVAIPFSLARSHALYRVGKNNNRHREHKVITQIGIVFQKFPTELFGSLPRIKYAERKQHRKRGHATQNNSVNQLRKQIFTEHDLTLRI